MWGKSQVVRLIYSFPNQRVEEHPELPLAQGGCARCFAHHALQAHNISDA
jgi:hypothetical protein